MARLPEIFERDALPEDKRHVHDYLVQTRGRVSPGFGTILNQPEVAYRIAQLGSFIRFESSLPHNVRELAALTASAELHGVYEQALHTRDALPTGAAQSTIDAINSGSEPTEATPEEAIAIRCARELMRARALSDEAFELAVATFGKPATVELIATIAYYAMLAYVHNALLVGR